MTDATLAAAVRAAARPLSGAPSDHDALLDLVGERRLVLLGEGSHGTHEFYAARVAITRRLIEERGFDAVAVEGDWPDSDRVHRWVVGRTRGGGADDALGGFRRFPQWMWRNADVVRLAELLRAHNARVGRARAVGFHGLDLYSLHASIDEVLRYLDRVDPDAARRARQRYACFEHFGEDPQEYGYAASFDLSRSCEDAVVEQLVELRRRDGGTEADAAPDEWDAAEDRFSAEQNARLVLDAERYYRSMFRGRTSSWNLRDTHMADTLDALVAHLRARGRAGKVVVWAHNSHLGDARATKMGAGGEINLGQLARERHGDDAVLVGFTTHEGTVTAAHDWGDAARRMRVNPSLPGSIERLLHDAAPPNAVLPLRGDAADAAREALSARALLERAIGVIYRPRTERQSHYFHARVGAQFDCVYHFDATRAVAPLDRDGALDPSEPPETYPSAL
ncbi:erythromycin esterase family protein [Roseisolibacter sp. H3M3-2]|uniref:erythromycin esterase family protein n=1 Tax=Roseisolibacter sp. H3M3-2 TaxID=3031323 RepID=UPI0023DA934B|nr:erythromycin esterase family protein [Roseisolibacter sp. H3M3-2]MDF1503904.1 erythromycin esterase family protein [Roseisolibacter sp. H3M3-2]